MAIVESNLYYDMKRKADMSNSTMQSADQTLDRERQRLEQLTRQIGGMSSKDLSEMQKKFDVAREDIQEDLFLLREEFGRQLGRQAIENQRAIEGVRNLALENKRDLRELEAQVSQVEHKIHAQVNEIAEKIENDRKQATYYYYQLAEIINEISKLFPEKYEVLYPERLHPGYRVLKSTEGYVAEDIELKHYEAAIGLAQIGLREAVTVLSLLEFLHKDFLSVQSETKNSLQKIRSRMTQIEKPKETEILIGDTEYVDTNGITYWARELYRDLQDRLMCVQKDFEEADFSHDTERLIRILEEIKIFDEQLTQCERIESSERRLHYECCEKAAQIFDALNENDHNDWNVELHVQEDLRNPVCITLRNTGGHMLTVACTPQREEDMSKPERVKCVLDAFDRDGQKEDLTRCEIIYKNTVTVLSGYGLRMEERDQGIPFENNCKTFVDKRIQQEEQNRLAWIETTKRKLCLLKEE